jgi:hypothetical protein
MRPAGERGQGKRLAALLCMKTHKDTAAHTGKENPCQPWERLTNEAAFGERFSISPCSTVADIHTNRLRHGRGTD